LQITVQGTKMKIVHVILFYYAMAVLPLSRLPLCVHWILLGPMTMKLMATGVCRQIAAISSTILQHVSWCITRSWPAVIADLLWLSKAITRDFVRRRTSTTARPCLILLKTATASPWVMRDSSAPFTVTISSPDNTQFTSRTRESVGTDYLWRLDCDK